jgi:hypothetical protein
MGLGRRTPTRHPSAVQHVFASIHITDGAKSEQQIIYLNGLRELFRSKNRFTILQRKVSSGGGLLFPPEAGDRVEVAPQVHPTLLLVPPLQVHLRRKLSKLGNIRKKSSFL